MSPETRDLQHVLKGGSSIKLKVSPQKGVLPWAAALTHPVRAKRVPSIILVAAGQFSSFSFLLSCAT